MRILFMLLVLANVGLFAWLHWHGGNGESALPAGRPPAANANRLVLVGEQAEQVAGDEGEQVALQVEPADVVTVEEGAVEVQPVCATVGPFDQPELAEVAHARLSDLGIKAQVRESGGQIRSGFWVYLPPFSSRGAAKDVEAVLRERGVRDLFIVTGSENRNAISLGLFSTADRADQRAAEIGRLGFTPRVAERFRDATVYWLDFRELPDEPLEPQRLGVAGAGETVPEKREISCDDIANGVGGA